MKPPSPIRSHAWRDVTLTGWEEKIVGRWHYRDLAADPHWHHGWVSFDTVTYNPGDGSIYCGVNSLDGDLLHRFDPASGRFTSLGTQRWTDAYDAKIHRGLLLNPRDDCFYFATSLLHDLDQQHKAPGGKLVRYDWKNDDYTILGIPFPHLYVQSLTLDAERGILYGFTYPAEFLFRHDLASGETRTLAYVGNALAMAQPHNAVVDRHGWLWCTCAETRAWDEVPGPCPIRLFKYHPDENRFVWLEQGLARRSSQDQLVPDPPGSANTMPDMTESRHKEDLGFCDSMATDGGRYLYAGSTAGVLSRIDTETNAVEKIATIMAAGRLPALDFSPEGQLFGAGGMQGRTALFRYDPETLELRVRENLRDPDTGGSPARIHDICLAGDTLFLAENDNHQRSSYLWSTRWDNEKTHPC